MLIYNFCILAHFFIFLRHNILALKILPNFNLVDWFKDPSAFLWVKIKLSEVGSSFSLCPVKTCSEWVEKISQLVVFFISNILISLSEEWYVNFWNEGVQGPNCVLSDRGDQNLVLDALMINIFVIKLYKMHFHSTLGWLSHLSGKTFKRLAISYYLKSLNVQFIQEHRKFRRCCYLCSQFRDTKQPCSCGGQILWSRIVWWIHDV